MSKVAIVTDSTAFIPAELVAKYPIRVAPLLLQWDDDTYRDGIDITPQDFYARLKTSSTVPTSSQVTPVNFKNLFLDLLEQDYDILTILISAKLSGTVDSAVQAKAAVKSDNIEIIDSEFTSMATGLQVLAVAKAALEGANLAECKKLAEEARSNSGVYFTVDTLKYLHMGGRIGGAARFMGTALDLKPILYIHKGKIEAAERVRTQKKAIERMFELVENEIAGRTPLYMSTVNIDVPELGDLVSTTARQRFNPIDMINTGVSPVIGTHAGPGTVGLAYLAGIQ